MRNNVVQSALMGLVRKIGLKNVAFEVTQECNQDCLFCYNVWKCRNYPRGQYDTERTKELIDRIIRGYKPQFLAFTGGEPLLRPDIIDLVSYASNRVSCNLITNGTLMTDELAVDLVKAGVRVFEFTLLSADRDVHNSLVGRSSFDQLIEGIASVRAAGGRVATTFVATRKNIDGWQETLELNAALGVSGILFNRFNVGGAGVERARELMPSISELKSALEIAEEGSKRYGVGISCGVPFPPCVMDRAPYKHIGFGDCPVGTRRGYPTVDPLGNVRPCNHSATILGNLFEEDFPRILNNERSNNYSTWTPDECLGCKDLKSCRGGCRAAAEVCGSESAIDPFVHLSQSRCSRLSHTGVE